jgi:tRNA G46 methylase TrmB
MVPIENLILGFVKLVDIQGRIASDREVAVYSPFISQKIGDRLVTGGEFSTRTDNAGYASFYLLRGTTVDLSVLGTSLLQRVRVPSDLSLTEFDLLDPAYADRDSFAVQKTNQPFAERRNL